VPGAGPPPSLAAGGLERALLFRSVMRSGNVTRQGLVIALALCAAACGSISTTPEDAAGTAGAGGGAGGAGGAGAQDGGGDGGDVRRPCRELAEAACRLRSDCSSTTCRNCSGVNVFGGCYDPTVDPAPICSAEPGAGAGGASGITAPCPIPCSSLNEAACKLRSTCRVDSCPGCNGTSNFVRCAESNDPPPLCPAIACPQPV
jgi:hypothetical protein